MMEPKHFGPWRVEDVRDYVVVAGDGFGWWEAVVQWDGCVEITEYFNDPKGAPGRNSDDMQSFHFCNIDDAIELLKQVREIGRHYFKDRHYWQLPD